MKKKKILRNPSKKTSEFPHEWAIIGRMSDMGYPRKRIANELTINENSVKTILLDPRMQAWLKKRRENLIDRLRSNQYKLVALIEHQLAHGVIKERGTYKKGKFVIKSVTRSQLSTKDLEIIAKLTGDYTPQLEVSSKNDSDPIEQKNAKKMFHHLKKLKDAS